LDAPPDAEIAAAIVLDAFKRQARAELELLELNNRSQFVDGVQTA